MKLDPSSTVIHPWLLDVVPKGAADAALLAEVTHLLTGSVEPVQPASPIGASSEQAVIDSAVARDFLVHRRALAVLTSQLSESLPSWAAGLKVERTLGPLKDRFGRDVWFDVFRRVRQVRFVRAIGAAPFLSLPIQQMQRFLSAKKIPTEFKIGKGSLWFATRLLTTAAADGIYTGLRIAGGTIRFGQPIALAGDEVIVPTGIHCEITLELDPPAPPAGSDPGRDVREAQSRTPRHIVLNIGPAGATLQINDTAQLSVYGFDTELDPVVGPSSYLPQWNRVTLPLVARKSVFAVAKVYSSTYEPDGTAHIANAAWALPAATIDPAHLGEASGVGALMLGLDAGLSATWTGQTTPVALGPTILMIDEARLAIVSTAAHGDNVAQYPKLPEVTRRARVAMIWRSSFPLSFFAQASGTEAIITTCVFDASMEQPVDVNGDRVAISAPSALVVLIANAVGTLLWAQGTLPSLSGNRGPCFGLTNAVLRASLPRTFICVGVYEGTAIDRGLLALGYDLFGILPTLPDPYAANAGLRASDNERPIGTVFSVLRWTNTHQDLEFLLPDNTQSTLASATAFATGEFRIRTGAPSTNTAAVQHLQSLSLSKYQAAQRFNPNDEIGPAIKALGNALDFESRPNLILLDVSTNIDQFGVALRTPQRENFSAAATTPLKPMAINGLDLAVDSRFLVLLTLPAVQWEPVQAEPVVDDPSFPPRLTFLNSGVPTIIDVPTVNLVPVTPGAALGAIAQNFADPAPKPAAARFTLPFGMLAKAKLRATDAVNPRGATVSLVQPTATVAGLRGGHQLRIEAVDPSLLPDQTPSLPGFAVQLPIAIPSDGSPGPRSILGTSVSNIFNNYLGASGTSPQVPVTRIDISGYGESLFSAWVNPKQDSVQVSKAQFDVLIGRTAHEVVQVRSILLPYRVPVVRTITLERKNNAVITRHDSGWVAVADGAYVGNPAEGIVTHPGVVRRMTNVSHIRETGQRITKNGIEFAAAYYQGDVVLDGAAHPVPVSGHFGFIQIGTTPLTPAAYAALIAEAGPLCGSIDTTIAIGGGYQGMRLHRIGVGVTEAISGPEFVMTAWGGLAFPGGGEWSVLQTDDAVGAPQSVPQDRGLPLIRVGAADGPPPTGPYRFADPEDLARESAPARDYGILHATGTQRVFFRRPRIEASDLGRVVSTERPVIADPYILATALGPFPLQSDTIPFPTAPWALAVDAAGHYKLEMPATTFPAAIPRRTIRQAGSVKSDLDYSTAMVTYEIDTANPVPWRFGLTGAAKIVNNPTMGDMITLSANVAAAAGQPTIFDKPTMQLGGALSIVQDLLTILADLGITGIMSTKMTNAWSLKVALTIPFKDATGKDLQVPPLVPIPDIKFADTGIKVEIDVAPSADSASFELGGTPMFSIKSVPGLYVIGMIKFTIKLSTESGTTYGILIGFGVAYELDAGPFGLNGLIAITFFVVFGDTTLGYGVGFLVKVSLELEPIFSLELSLEGKLARIVVDNGLPDETVFCAAKLTFAVEVSVFLVLSISFEVETQQVTILRGPLPATALPDVL